MNWVFIHNTLVVKIVLIYAYQSHKYKTTSDET